MDRLRGALAEGVLAAAISVAVTVAGALVCVAAVLTAPALGCTNLATINLSTEAARPGDTVAVTGTSFPVPRAQSGLPPTPVEIHWDTPEGPLLAKVVPDRSGTIAATFTIPQSAPGPVVIIATQRRVLASPNAVGASAMVDEYGTPARATLRVLAPGERATTIVAESEFGPLTTDSGSTAMIVMLVLFGAVALSLFAGGVIAFFHQVRQRNPVPQPWRTW